MDQSETTIRRRIDQLGLREPVIEPYGQGDNEIIVELAGEGDPVRRQDDYSGWRPARNSAGERSAPYTLASRSAGRAQWSAAAKHRVSARERPDATLDRRSGPEVWYLLARDAVITGRDLRTAQAPAQYGTPALLCGGLQPDDGCRPDFGPFTEPNIGKSIAMVLDHRVASRSPRFRAD